MSVSAAYSSLKTGFTSVAQKLSRSTEKDVAANLMKKQDEVASVFSTLSEDSFGPETLKPVKNDLAGALNNLPANIKQMFKGITFDANGTPMLLTPEGKNIIARDQKKAIQQLINPTKLEAYAQLRGVGAIENAAAKISNKVTTFLNKITAFGRKVLNAITAPFRYIYNQVQGLFVRTPEAISATPPHTTPTA